MPNDLLIMAAAALISPGINEMATQVKTVKK